MGCFLDLALFTLGLATRAKAAAPTPLPALRPVTARLGVRDVLSKRRGVMSCFTLGESLGMPDLLLGSFNGVRLASLMFSKLRLTDLLGVLWAAGISGLGSLAMGARGGDSTSGKTGAPSWLRPAGGTCTRLYWRVGC